MIKLINNLTATISLNSKSFSTNVALSNKTNNTLYPDKDIRESIAHVPNVNLARNNKRLSSAIAAIQSFLNTQTRLSDTSRDVLVTLMNDIRKVHISDPRAMVMTCKMLGNWFKVNVFAITRSKGLIPDASWDSHTLVPRSLRPIFAELARLTTPQERIVFIRMVLSIMDLYQVVITPTKPNSNTITKQGTDVSQVLQDTEIQQAFEFLNIDPAALTEEFKFSNSGHKFHLSSASGPNGQAVWNSHLDAKAILADKEVLEHLTKICELLGRNDLLTVLNEAATLPNLLDSEGTTNSHSKLHVIFEKGDKARIIAILDYFTQEVLSPFHDIIAGILRSLPEDGTFDQNAIAMKVKEMTTRAKATLYSFDLTAATDRLPVTLQRSIISKLILIDGYSFAWQKLLTFRTFKTPTGQDVRYAVGQPMGAKSSFPMLGLTHHIIVQIAAIRAGFLSKFEDYVILGDDIMIADAKVSALYQAIMKDLGLEISEFKSIISTPETTTMQIAEICRRVFVNGLEFTPLPMKLIANVFEHGSLMLQLQEKMEERGLIVDHNRFPLFTTVFKLSQREFDFAGLMNSLPQWLSKITTPVDYGTSGEASFSEMKANGLSEEMLLEFWKFTIISEQFKRLSTLIQTADNGFRAISKSISLGDILFVEGPDGAKVNASKFTLETLQNWQILGKAHPARFVMLSEVDRISTIMARLASARGATLFLQLLDNVIDTLKYSILEVVRDQELKRSMVQKMLVDKVIDNIKKARDNDSQALSFSTKIDSLGVVWILKVQLHGSCVLSQQVMNSPTTLKDSELALQNLRRNSSKPFSLFKKSA